ncbi:unnamed protein product [Rotaria sp. Silwood1]|nr:unnamed protein product [Rotaria sp. Silwood1]CAF4972837.1 unnamed protein product [Rotaria sp. Silwood1]
MTEQSSQEHHQSSSLSSSSDENQTSVSIFRSSEPAIDDSIIANGNKLSKKCHEQNIEYDDKDNNNKTNEPNTKKKLLNIKFKLEKQAQQQGSKDKHVTSAMENYTYKQHDEQTIFEYVKTINEELTEIANDKIYRDINIMKNFMRKKYYTRKYK